MTSGPLEAFRGQWVEVAGDALPGEPATEQSPDPTYAAFIAAYWLATVAAPCCLGLYAQVRATSVFSSPFAVGDLKWERERLDKALSLINLGESLSSKRRLRRMSDFKSRGFSKRVDAVAAELKDEQLSTRYEMSDDLLDAFDRGFDQALAESGFLSAMSAVESVVAEYTDEVLMVRKLANASSFALSVFAFDAMQTGHGSLGDPFRVKSTFEWRLPNEISGALATRLAPVIQGLRTHAIEAFSEMQDQSGHFGLLGLYRS